METRRQHIPEVHLHASERSAYWVALRGYRYDHISSWALHLQLDALREHSTGIPRDPADGLIHKIEPRYTEKSTPRQKIVLVYIWS